MARIEAKGVKDETERRPEMIRIRYSSVHFLPVLLAVIALAAATTAVASPEEAPIVLERAKILASEGSQEDRLGNAVALEGDWLAVGAHTAGILHLTNKEGSVYLFRRDAGEWVEFARLTASDGGQRDYFGEDVAISGDLVVVGAPMRDSNGHLQPNGENEIGAAYVFEQGVEIAKLEPSDGVRDNLFGVAVALDGETIVVGAERGSGAAYIFERDPGSGEWLETQKLEIAVNPESFDGFGNALALDGDTLVVGADARDVAGDPWAGAVYIFERQAGGAWELSDVLTTTASSRLGRDVALDGDTLLIGANGEALIFERAPGGDWHPVAKLAPEPQIYGDFGESVDLAGDLAVVGAASSFDWFGAVAVFRRDAGGPDGWGQIAELAASDGERIDFLGEDVAIDGLTIVAGATGDDDQCSEPTDLCESGAAYVYGRE